MLTRRRIEALAEVSTLPLLSRKIISALSNDATTVYDYEELISHDQALASKVVSTANSAFYHTHRGIAVNSIDQAILVLGLDAIRNIALGISIFKIFPVPYEALKQMWAHAYRVALASGFLASRIGQSDREVAFLAGLLHDIGKIVLLTVGNEGELSRFPGSKGKDMIRVEQEVFSCSHMEAGYWFLRGLSLPEEVILPVLYHHEFPEKAEHPLITAPVYIAEGLLGGYPGDEAADGAWSEGATALAAEYAIGQGVLDECIAILAMDDEFIRAFFEY